MANSKNWAFWAGIAIPILMILIIISSIYWPSAPLQPKTDFLYMMVENSADTFDLKTNKQYEIQQGKLIEKSVDKFDKFEKYKTKFFIYNVIKNKSKEISFSEAQKFILDINHRSPDGFEIIQGKKDAEGIFSFFFDFGLATDYNAYYLKKNNTGIKLNITSQFNHQNYYIFRFLGWIKNQGDSSHVY